MRKYLEIKQELTKAEKIEKEPEFIRIDVTDKTAEEINAKVKDLKPLIKNSKPYLHSHSHSKDSKLNRPCKIEELDLEEKEDGLK